MSRAKPLVTILAVLAIIATGDSGKAQQKQGLPTFTDGQLNCRGWQLATDSERVYWVMGYQNGIVVGVSIAAAPFTDAEKLAGAAEMLFPPKMLSGLGPRITLRCSDPAAAETRVHSIVEGLASEFKSP